MKTIFLLFALSVACAAATRWYELDAGYTFEKYMSEFNKVYATEQEHSMRKQIFENNLRIVMEHNGDATQTWKRGINHLSDRTDAEFKALMGYKKMNVDNKAARIPAPSKPVGGYPARVDWRDKNIISPVKDQGRCGSCWTFATAATVESYYAKATGHLTILSEQQILDCTPNPNDCGGTGGCEGGTADIAYQKIMELGGLSSEWTYPYISYFGQNYDCHFNASMTVPVAKLSNYVKVQSNDYYSVMDALTNIGPLAINVAASFWRDYEQGVYMGCNATTLDINHVVQLVGYGTDQKYGDYWIVRNSWTTLWGENGYIRMPRTEKPECGTDNSPMDGTGCTGGPPSVTACGPCGLLYDTSYPIIQS